MNKIVEVVFGTGILIALVNNIMQAKAIYINNINNKRNSSIEALRKEMAKIISFCILKQKAEKDKKSKIQISLESRFLESIAMVRMRLSIYPERMGNFGQDILDNKLNEIIDTNKINCNTANELIFLTKQILSYEWERVKKEAKGAN